MPWPFSKPKLAVVVERGKGSRHRWRWQAVNENLEIVALSPVEGYESEDEARAAAKAAGDSKWDLGNDLM